MRRNKQRKRSFISLKYKLFGYFLLFGSIIVLVLWIFQSFFLESFYTMRKMNQVEKNAAIITRAIEENKNIRGTIENVASYNSLSVYAYAPELLFDKMYACEYDNPATTLYFDYNDLYSYYYKVLNSGGPYMCVTSKYEDNSAGVDFDAKTIDKSATINNRDAEIHYIKDHSKTTKNMVYADILYLQDGSECFLLITSSITPLTSIVGIIRDQMFVVMLVFLVLAVLFSIYASRRIANPISKTNKSAKELARKNYKVDFDARGYREVEELNETLNYAKRELEATERLQRELIANISHDLRTPLTMITGYSEVMRDLPGENTPENIQVIIDESTRLSLLVNDLLDLSKLQSGTLPVTKEKYSLTDSIDDIFCRYSKLKEQDGYNIEFISHENVFIYADELRISQVVYNLVNNAINYAGEDKTVIVTQKVDGKKVIIEVTDHGKGIPSEDFEHIWERYYKVEKEHKRDIIGSGLGLSIAKGVLDAHNARYGLRSTLGKGSTFWFELDTVEVKKDE